MVVLVCAFFIEDAMRRAHRRPRDRGSAIPLCGRWFMLGVSLRTVCASSGFWQILASAWQDGWCRGQQE